MLLSTTVLLFQKIRVAAKSIDSPEIVLFLVSVFLCFFFLIKDLIIKKAMQIEGKRRSPERPYEPFRSN